MFIQICALSQYNGFVCSFIYPFIRSFTHPYIVHVHCFLTQILMLVLVLVLVLVLILPYLYHMDNMN